MSSGSTVLLDAAGRRRSPATIPGYLAGRAPHNKGMQYAPDPPRPEEIIVVMRQAGHDRHGLRLRALIAVLWRGGLRISEALALRETDIDERRGISCTVMAFRSDDYLTMMGEGPGVDEVLFAEAVYGGRATYVVDTSIFCHHVNYYPMRAEVRALGETIERWNRGAVVAATRSVFRPDAAAPVTGDLREITPAYRS